MTLPISLAKSTKKYGKVTSPNICLRYNEIINDMKIIGISRPSYRFHPTSSIIPFTEYTKKYGELASGHICVRCHEVKNDRKSNSQIIHISRTPFKFHQTWSNTEKCGKLASAGYYKIWNDRKFHSRIIGISRTTFRFHQVSNYNSPKRTWTLLSGPQCINYIFIAMGSNFYIQSTLECTLKYGHKTHNIIRWQGILAQKLPHLVKLITFQRTNSLMSQ